MLIGQAAGPAPATDLLGGLEVQLFTVVRIALVALIVIFVATRLERWFERVTTRTKASPHTRFVVGRLLALSVVVIGLITILDALGIPLGATITFFGVLGVALSLALQDILKNVMAGLYLIFEGPFRIGDLLVVKDQRGVVEKIGLRTTRLRNEENVLIIVPNVTVFNEIVSNRTDARPPSDHEAQDVGSQ